MSTQYFIANLDSSKNQIFTSFYTYPGVTKSYSLRGAHGLTDFINLSVNETGYYTIAAKQGWLNKYHIPSSMRYSLSSNSRINGAAEEYFVAMDDNTEWFRSSNGIRYETLPGERHMIPAIALYTNSDVLTGNYLETQRSPSYVQSREKHPVGYKECIGQALPLMENERTIPSNYYNGENYMGWSALSSLPVNLRDFSFGESRDFVHLSAGQIYTLLASQISTRGARFAPNSDPSEDLQSQYDSLIANGNYYIEVNKVPHVTNTTLSSSEGGLYFSDGTGRLAITELNYFIAPDVNIRDENNIVTQRSTYLTNADNYLSATELFEVYYNKFSIEYDLDESNTYGIPLQFNLIAGGLNFGRWLAWVGQGDPATTECDFVITRKADRSAIRVQGELSYANYKSLSCTDVTGMVNTPSLQRLRNLGYV